IPSEVASLFQSSSEGWWVIELLCLPTAAAPQYCHTRFHLQYDRMKIEPRAGYLRFRWAWLQRSRFDQRRRIASYSSVSASMGALRATVCAGLRLANSTTTHTISAAVVKTVASCADTPKSNDRATRASAIAPAAPNNVPHSPITPTRLSTNERSCRGSAPRASRSPNSRVRRVTL